LTTPIVARARSRKISKATGTSATVPCPSLRNEPANPYGGA